MTITGTLLVGLALSMGQPKVNPSSEAEPKFSVDVSETTKSVKSGKKGQFVLHIKAAPGFKVSQDAPLKVKLASDGVALAKSTLKAKDATDKKFTSPRFQVPFTGAKAGDTAIGMNAMFFICDVEICERKTAQLSVPVSVRP